jgi:hypothetical protein
VEGFFVLLPVEATMEGEFFNGIYVNLPTRQHCYGIYTNHNFCLYGKGPDGQ